MEARTLVDANKMPNDLLIQMASLFGTSWKLSGSRSCPFRPSGLGGVLTWSVGAHVDSVMIDQVINSEVFAFNICINPAYIIVQLSCKLRVTGRKLSTMRIYPLFYSVESPSGGAFVINFRESILCKDFLITSLPAAKACKQHKFPMLNDPPSSCLYCNNLCLA